MPYGDAYHHAHVPDAGELPCESVVHVRVCHEVSSREEHLRQIGSPGEFRCLAADVHGIGEEFQFGAIPVCHGVGTVNRILFDGDSRSRLVGKRDVRLHRHSAGLAEEHLGKGETVFHLRHRHLRLVHLHADLESVSLGSHSRRDHLLHVVVEFLHELQEAVGEVEFMAERHHGPVSLVDVLQRVLACQFLVYGSHLLVDVGDIVCRRDGSTHIYRLRHHCRSHIHGAVVGAEAVHHILSQMVQRSLQFGVADAEQSAERGADVLECGLLGVVED